MMTEVSRRNPIIKDQYYYKGDLTNTTAVDNGTGTGTVKPMYYESNRLRSFTGWNNRYIRPEELAKQGFYYIHINDNVRCAFCNIELGNWEENDSVELDHRRYSPDCPFLCNKSGNIPLGLNANENTNMPQEGQDTCGKYGVEVRPNSCTEREEPSISSFNKLNLPNIGKPAAFPDYIRLEKRLESFKEWPLSIAQRPQQLAEAGFFYTGKSDQTLCFFCGGGLKNWERDDDPWEQHAIWFTKCNYLLLQKGRDYITEVCNKHKAVITQSQAASLNGTGEVKSSGEVKDKQQQQQQQQVVVNSEKERNSPNSVTTLCKICYDKEIGMVFLPCGHICACIDCATGLGNCAVCRRVIEATNRVFLS